jgi:hypothetical protein
LQNAKVRWSGTYVYIACLKRCNNALNVHVYDSIHYPTGERSVAFVLSPTVKTRTMQTAATRATMRQPAVAYRRQLIPPLNCSVQCLCRPHRRRIPMNFPLIQVAAAAHQQQQHLLRQGCMRTIEQRRIRRLLEERRRVWAVLRGTECRMYRRRRTSTLD